MRLRPHLRPSPPSDRVGELHRPARRVPDGAIVPRFALRDNPRGRVAPSFGMDGAQHRRRLAVRRDQGGGGGAAHRGLPLRPDLPGRFVCRGMAQAALAVRRPLRLLADIGPSRPVDRRSQRNDRTAVRRRPLGLRPVPVARDISLPQALLLACSPDSRLRDRFCAVRPGAALGRRPGRSARRHGLGPGQAPGARAFLERGSS